VNRIVRSICAALFLGTTACSLVLSASSTLAKAAAVHVPGAALWSAVGVLELVSLAGTLRWLTATTARGRVHAMVVVAAVAVVTGVAGVAVYGWFGLVAPIAIVATIHMVHETLADTETPARTSEPVTEVIPVTEPETVAIEQPEPATTPSALDGVDALTVYNAQALLAANPKMGRPRLKAELGVTDHTAKRLLAALRPVKAVEESA
jgi:hypothetical protein